MKISPPLVSLDAALHCISGETQLVGRLVALRYWKTRAARGRNSGAGITRSVAANDTLGQLEGRAAAAAGTVTGGEGHYAQRW